MYLSFFNEVCMYVHIVVNEKLSCESEEKKIYKEAPGVHREHPVYNRGARSLLRACMNAF